MRVATAAWILQLITKASAPGLPQTATFEKTADAIAVVANASPLFSGEGGAEQTAALFVSVARYESSFIPNAEGDCVLANGKAIASVAGVCPSGSKPNSFCLMQIGESNFRFLGVTKTEIQSDVNVCVKSASVLLHQSFRTCHDRDLRERLAHYAGGGSSCPTNNDAISKSRHRMDYGAWLLKQLPPTSGASPAPNNPGSSTP